MPIIFPASSLPINQVPIGMVGPTSADDTTQSPSYWEGLLNVPTGQLFDQLFANHSGDWNSWLSSVSSLFVTGFVPSRYGCISLPLFPDSVGGSMDQAASGTYNTYYTKMATNCKDVGCTGLVYRLAPEFNGNWFPDSYGQSTDQAGYPAAFQNAFWQARNSIIAVDSTARFCFNPNATPTTLNDWSACFPAVGGGISPVSCIGLDFYDQPDISGLIDPKARFAADQAPGIQFAANFAESYGQQTGIWIPLCVPEFGTGACGGNPEFFDQIVYSMSGNWLAFFCYWNQGVGSSYVGDLDDGAIPQTWAKQAFIADFARPTT